MKQKQKKHKYMTSIFIVDSITIHFSDGDDGDVQMTQLAPYTRSNCHADDQTFLIEPSYGEYFGAQGHVRFDEAIVHFQQLTFVHLQPHDRKVRLIRL